MTDTKEKGRTCRNAVDAKDYGRGRGNADESTSGFMKSKEKRWNALLTHELCTFFPSVFALFRLF